jgi:hypothetical protein
MPMPGNLGGFLTFAQPARSRIYKGQKVHLTDAIGVPQPSPTPTRLSDDLIHAIKKDKQQPKSARRQRASLVTPMGRGCRPTPTDHHFTMLNCRLRSRLI